jgi:hypothetical protein
MIRVRKGARPFATFIRKRLERRWFVCRQREPEASAYDFPALAFAILGADLSAVGLHDRPANCETQADPGFR